MAIAMDKHGVEGKETVTITAKFKAECLLTAEALGNAKLQILDDVSAHFDKAARNIVDDDFDRAYVNDKGKLLCKERADAEPEKPEKPEEPEEPEGEDKDKDKGKDKKQDQ